MFIWIQLLRSYNELNYDKTALFDIANYIKFCQNLRSIVQKTRKNFCMFNNFLIKLKNKITIRDLFLNYLSYKIIL